MKRSATLLIAAALALTTIAACGGGDKKTVKVPGGGSVTVDKGGNDGQVTFTDDKGNRSSFGASQEVPDDFPKAVPLPDDAKLTGSIFGESDGKSGWTLTYESSKDVADFAKAYRSSLEDAGFKVDSFSVMGSGADSAVMAGASNGDWQVSVMGSNTEGKGSLVLSVAPADTTSSTG